MSHRIRILAAVAATLSASLLAAPQSDAAPVKGGDHGCVNTYEWSHLTNGTLSDLDGPNGGARRSVVEQAWDVLPVGYRNQFWIPGNDALYSQAYNFCQNPEMMIVLVYRKTSGAWQYAMKGPLGAMG